MLSQQHLEYLTQTRSLDGETLARYGVETFALPNGGDAISFPFYFGNEIVNHKYRTIDKRFSQDKGGQQIFWNVNALFDTTLSETPVVITEGEIDALTAIQAGFLRTVSVPSGAPSQELGEGQKPRYSFLDDAKKLFANATEIIIATDGDTPGIALLNDIAIRLGKVRCKYIKYPLQKDKKTRCKDLNEVLQNWGIQGVVKVLNNATWINKDGVYSMNELPPIEDRAVFNIGMSGLDPLWKIRKKDFVVVTGIPSHGKSSFLNDIACRMVQNHGWRVAFASFEQEPQTDHRRNLRTWFLQKAPQYATADQITEADKFIENGFRFIIPSEDDLPNLEWILEKMAQSVVQHDCDMVIIDPWNEMDHSRPHDMTMTEYTGFAIKEFKRLAKALNITVIVAAHPAKMRGDDGVPGLYNISDSAHWANKTDAGIVVHRPDKSVNITEIYVQKIKYAGINGKEGMAKMQYLDHMKRYELVEDDTKQYSYETA